MDSQQYGATFSIPVVVPPELAELAKDLTELKDRLREEIEHYRANREKTIFSEREAADFFGISLKSMRQIRGGGKINFTSVKGQFFYLRKNLEEYVEREQTKCRRK